MPQQEPQTAAPELDAEVIARLGPESYVTHEDDYLDDEAVWTVVVDGHIVKHFPDDGLGEDAAVEFRCRVQEYVKRLSSREAAIQGIRDCADFLDAHPDVPIPAGGYFVRHYDNADDFDVAAMTLGVESQPSSNGFETAARRFGPVEFRIQTNGREDQREALLAERERRVAEREAVLGIAETRQP
jgi:hypothetical protein